VSHKPVQACDRAAHKTALDCLIGLTARRCPQDEGVAVAEGIRVVVDTGAIRPPQTMGKVVEGHLPPAPPGIGLVVSYKVVEGHLPPAPPAIGMVLSYKF